MTEENKTLLKYGAIAGGVLYVGSLLLKAVGLIKSDAELKAEADAAQIEKGAAANAQKLDVNNKFLCFNPNYWLTIIAKVKKDKKITNFSMPQLNVLFNPNLSNGKGYNVNLGAMIDTLGSAKKVWWLPDTEENVIGVFRALKSQLQIAKLSSEFNNFYKNDLLAYMKTFMNAEQLQEIYNIVKTKPLY